MTDLTAVAAGENLRASVSHISLMSRPIGAPRMHLSEEAAGGAPSANVTASTETGSDVVITAPEGTEALTESRAGRMLAEARWKQRQPSEAAAAVAGKAAPAAEDTPNPTGERAADAATPDDELSGEDNAAQAAEPATGETKASDPAAETQPPLEMPRSWTKAQAEHWKALPRPTQEYLIEQASTASAEVRKVQNETAEKLKGLEAKEQLAEQARSQYEGRLKSVVSMLEREQVRDFPDIRSQDDLDRMRAEAWAAADINSPQADPLKALQLQAKLSAWDAHQQKLQGATHELQAAETRKAEEGKTKRSTYQQAQRAKLNELVPELADQKNFVAAWERALPELASIGLSREILDRLSNTPDGSEILFSAAFQKLIVDSQQLSDLKAKNASDEAARKAAIEKAKANTTPVPPVQRPGTPAPRGATETTTIQALTRKLETSGSFKDALALRQAKTRAAERRA